MIWNIINNIAGVLAIVGSLAVAFWYGAEVKRRMKELSRGD